MHAHTDIYIFKCEKILINSICKPMLFSISLVHTSTYQCHSPFDENCDSFALKAQDITMVHAVIDLRF